MLRLLTGWSNEYVLDRWNVVSVCRKGLKCRMDHPVKISSDIYIQKCSEIVLRNAETIGLIFIQKQKNLEFNMPNILN